MTADLHAALLRAHYYTVSELANAAPVRLQALPGVTEKKARELISQAGEVLLLLRKRSDCRKLIRRMLTPRKGRSPARVMKKLQEAGINDIGSLATADPALLERVGIAEKEASSILHEAKMVENERLFREAGVPAGSLKKYFAAGILSPDELLTAHPVSLSERVGLSPGTIQRHAEMVAKARGKVPPARFSNAQVARGREELLSIPGLQDAELAKLQRAGIMSGRLLLAEDLLARVLHEIDESHRALLPLGFGQSTRLRCRLRCYSCRMPAESPRRRRALTTLLAALVALPVAATAETPSNGLTVARAFRAAHGPRIVRDYADLLALPNVASDAVNIRRNADYLTTRLAIGSVAGCTFG